MSIGGKKLWLILYDFCFKGKELNLIGTIQLNLLTFRGNVACVPHQSVYDMQRKT